MLLSLCLWISSLLSSPGYNRISLVLIIHLGLNDFGSVSLEQYWQHLALGSLPWFLEKNNSSHIWYLVGVKTPDCSRMHMAITGMLTRIRDFLLFLSADWEAQYKCKWIPLINLLFPSIHITPALSWVCNPQPAGSTGLLRLLVTFLLLHFPLGIKC